VQANRPETIQTLLKYEKRPGQAQSFFARINKDFRWPSSMPDYLKDSAFRDISEEGPDFDAEVGFNKIFFYDAFNRGEFIGHENEWVTVYEQKVLEYGQSAVQIPVDQTRLPRGPPIKMLYSSSSEIDRVRRPNETLLALLPYDFIDQQNVFARGVNWRQLQMEQMGTGKIGVWDNRLGDKVQYALVGNDVSDLP
ncbi:11815_t:CDS:2, partial [Funneliformis mosseae]